MEASLSDGSVDFLGKAAPLPSRVGVLGVPMPTRASHSLGRATRLLGALPALAT
jgi:hypothetical protein